MYERAGAILREASASALEQRDVRRGIAEALVESGRYDEAAPKLEALLEGDELSALERPWLDAAMATVLTAQKGRAAGDRRWATAHAAFVAAAASDPSDLEQFRLQRGRALVQAGRAGEADALVRPAWKQAEVQFAEGSSRRFEPALTLGEIELAAGRIEAAAALIGEARRIDDAGDQLNESDRAELRLAEAELLRAQHADEREVAARVAEAKRLRDAAAAPLRPDRR